MSNNADPKSRPSAERVVLTGVGILSPLGVGVDAFRTSLAEGKSGVGPITRLEYTASPHNVGGEVAEFDEKYCRKNYPKPHRKSIKVMCREIQMGVASAVLALEDSGLDLDAVDHERFGVDFGANLMFSPPEVLKDACWRCTDEDDDFHYEQWGKAGGETGTTGMDAMEPLWLLRYLPNMPACHIGIFLDARGPNNSLTQDDASLNLALGEACRIIQRGRADVMIAGATGTRLHPVKTIHAALWDQLAESPDPPETWCRPFDKTRTGQVVSEGACSFLLETETHANARGAKILATVEGAGSSCVSDSGGRPDHTRAMVNAMRAALNDAGMKPEDVGCVNAHGLGSPEADRAEAAAIHEVFGGSAEETPVTALKSYFGNSGSASGALELAGSLVSLSSGVIPPTLNYERPDPECRLNVVHGRPLETSNRVVLSVNVTRMGQAAALIVRGA